MLNWLWGCMLLIGVVFGCINGKIPEITGAALDSAREAVTLAIAMLGVMGFWMGLLEIGSRTGLLERICRLLRPVMTFLFPGLKEESAAKEAIATNFAANLLGLGWAATPAGLKAMEELRKLHEKNCKEQYPESWKEKCRSASNEMCTFLVLNISSLQLIPMTIIAYRAEYGSVDPGRVIGPAIAATFASTLAAVVFVKAVTGRSTAEKKKGARRKKGGRTV